MRCVMPNGVVMMMRYPYLKSHIDPLGCPRKNITIPERLMKIKAWKKANKDRVLLAGRRAYAKHRARRNAQQRARWAKRYRENPQQDRDRKKKYAAQTRLANARWRAANHSLVTAYRRRNKKNNREARNARDQRRYLKRTAQLTDYIIRRYLARLKPANHNPTPKQIELCRQRIQLKRAQRLLKLQVSANALASL